MYEPAPALGFTPHSENEDVRRAAFQFLQECGYVILATTRLDGKTPASRGLEVHILDEEGNLYIGLSKGKPLYDELKAFPYLAATAVRSTSKRLSVSVRLTAEVEEVNSPALFARYWELNPGTKSLYRKDLANFKLFKLTKGEGEIFHVCEDDQTARVRFGFGGGSPTPFRYFINTEECIACGACQAACLTNTIDETDEGYYVINHFGCLECGKCKEVCPTEAIKDMIRRD